MGKIHVPSSELIRSPGLTFGKRPTGKVKVNFNHPVGKNIVAGFCDARDMPYGLAPHDPWETGGFAINGSSSFLIGNMIRMDADETYKSVNPVAIPANSSFSVVTQFAQLEAANYNYAFYCSAWTTCSFYMKSDGTTYIHGVDQGSPLLPYSYNQIVTAIYTTSSTGSAVAVKVKGNTIYHSGASTNSSVNDYLALAGRDDAATRSLAGYVGIVALFDMALDKNQMLSLVQDPYQFLIPA